ncbi:MFS transporter [Sediminibacillus massiliensis]|uniref:MFS transporter n=1 Tax=Sediminibacillus massiliensis TaxID=1926277 RepID=UPI0009884C69|nr:MFS transporter [Sediminibacillus massiliensis]
MKELFKNRNFFLLFLGRIITNMGDSLYTVAVMWLVYDLSGSAFYSGLAGFLVMAPAVLQFLTGPLIDRWPLKKTLVNTQVAQGLLVLLIPVAYYLNILSVPLLLVIMPLVSMLNQFVYPAQNAALPAILPKEQLIKGNSAFSFAYQGVDLVFNALAGIIIAIVGAAVLFLIDSVTFAITAVIFLLLKMPESSKDDDPSLKPVLGYWQELTEGVQFVTRSLLAKIFTGMIVANFAIGATLAVLPVYADENGGPELYGFYLAALSFGSLTGALAAPFLEKFRLGRLIIVSFAVGGSLWLCSINLPWAYAGAILFGIAWIPVGACNVIIAAAIQRIVPTHLLARVFSVMASVGASAAPLGSLLGGTIASVTSGATVFNVAAGGFLFLSAYYALTTRLRTLPAAPELDESHL